MQHESGPKAARSLLCRRKGQFVALSTFVSLYLAGAGVIFLISARTFLTFHVSISTPTSSLQPLEISPYDGVDFSRQISAKLLATDSGSLGFWESKTTGSSKTSYVARRNSNIMNSLTGGKVSNIKFPSISQNMLSGFGISDFLLPSNRSQELDLREKLHNMTARERRHWLKRNWATFQVLKTDALSDQFLTRVHRFLCGYNVETESDMVVSQIRDLLTDAERSVGQEVSEDLDTPLADVMTSRLGRPSPAALKPMPERNLKGAVSPNLLDMPDATADADEISIAEREKSIHAHDEERSCGGADRLSSVKKNHCQQRFFMTWISPVSTFGPRERLALESVFKWHPLACLVILSRSLDSESGKKILEPLHYQGYRIIAVAPDLSSLFRHTPAERWFRQLRQGTEDPGEINLMQNLSNIIRLVALYKYGGIYLDSDIIVLKSLAGLRNVVGAQSNTGNWTRLNNAVLVFDRLHPVIYTFIEEFVVGFDGSKWGHNGPYLVSRVVQKIKNSKQRHSISVLQRHAFYPVNWIDIVLFFRAPANHTETVHQDAVLEKLWQESYTIHLWNKMTGSLEVEKGSIMERVFKKSCILSKVVAGS